MKTYLQPGDTITIPAPTGGVTSGQPVLVGSLKGIASATAAEGEDVAIARKGVHSVVKATGSAWTVGAKIYLLADGSAFTTVATSNKLFGFATAAAASDATAGEICLADHLV